MLMSSVLHSIIIDTTTKPKATTSPSVRRQYPYPSSAEATPKAHESLLSKVGPTRITPSHSHTEKPPATPSPRAPAHLERCFMGNVVVSSPGYDAEVCHVGQTAQGFAAEPQGGDGVKVPNISKLACSVAFTKHGEVTYLVVGARTCCKVHT